MTGGVFDPQGPIAAQERDIIITVVAIMLVVAIPMLITLYTFAFKYRAGKGGKYDPEHTGSFWRQMLWWAVPGAVIFIIAILNWQSTHALDPYKPIISNVPPLEVEVVALQWKWLFIYPEQGIATVNYLEFPVNTPIHFDLTADAPMSSFWIPQLGSQIYAMAAMQTQLDLLASSTGQFMGRDTEINGAGYSGMIFTANSVTPGAFSAWVTSVQQLENPLTTSVYNQLALPSEDNPAAYYSTVQNDLYDTILMKYMIPSDEMPSSTTSPVATSTTQSMPGMSAMPGMNM